MKEEIVGFEVAKTASERGFAEWCSSAYFKIESIGMATEIPINSFISDTYLAPTQSFLQRWLREVHGLHITIFSKSQESWMFRITKPGQDLEDGLYGEDGDSYEDILEYALEEALNLINK